MSEAGSETDEEQLDKLFKMKIKAIFNEMKEDDCLEVPKVVDISVDKDIEKNVVSST